MRCDKLNHNNSYLKSLFLLAMGGKIGLELRMDGESRLAGSREGRATKGAKLGQELAH